MTDFEPQEDLPPVAHVTMVYAGPVAPHWDLRVRYGDQKLVDDFWARVNARLLLLPKHDPQFRRNKERVNRDAERERITCDWDLGEDDADTSITPVVEPVVEAPVEVVVEAEDAEVVDTDEGGESVAADADVDTEAVDEVTESSEDAAEADSDDVAAAEGEDVEAEDVTIAEGDDVAASDGDDAEVAETPTADV